jgi:hypothetical protein
MHQFLCPFDPFRTIVFIFLFSGGHRAIIFFYISVVVCRREKIFLKQKRTIDYHSNYLLLDQNLDGEKRTGVVMPVKFSSFVFFFN